MSKKILIVEPFFSGSHASWANQFKELSSHNIEILSMKGQFWKWRMYGGAITLAENFLAGNYNPDIILATDMLDLTTFLSLIRHKLSTHVKIAVYFHENQLTYPWKNDSVDKKLNRDINYGFMNYTTALAADYVLFNSSYNMNSFYDELYKVLKKMPDYRLNDTVEKLRNKSSVLPIGMHLSKLDSVADDIYYENPPLILWNHRWEFDKNPDDFFNALFILKERGLKFKVAILGENYKNSPPIFKKAFSVLKEEIVASGFMSVNEYRSWVKASDIIPVTSNHDFFGISVMEGVYSGCYPILAKRLTYPDLYKHHNNPELFYKDFDELVEKLAFAIENIEDIRKKDFKYLTVDYDWKNLICKYDELFDKL